MKQGRNTLTFEDYACFKNKQEVRLDSSLNLLFGPNNAGKTSFLKLLLYISNLYESNFIDINPIDLKIAGKLVHLGDLKAKINQKSSKGYLQVGDSQKRLKRIKLSESMKKGLSINEGCSHLQLRGKIEWSIGLDGDRIREIKINIKDILIEAGVLTFSDGFFRFEGFDTIEILELQHICNDNICHIIEKRIHADDTYKYQFSRMDLGFFLLFSLLRKTNSWVFDHYDDLTEGLTHKICDIVNNIILTRDDIAVLIRGCNISLKNYNKPINDFVDYIYGGEEEFKIQYADLNVEIDLNVLSLLREISHDDYEVINYLPPLREIPDDFITIRQKNSDYASLFLKNSRAKKPTVNDKDSILEENKATHLVDEIDFINELLLDLKFDHIFKIITVSDSNKSFEEEILVLENIHTGKISKINELGTGLSQILPIILKLFQPDPFPITKHEEIVDFVSFTSLTIVEQPEVHLHPGLQAKIGQICSRYLKYYGNGVIFFETHSEHIIKSIQLEVAKYHATNGAEGIPYYDVSIFYFSSENGESNIREITLDETGSFTEPWPDDFFEISGDLTLERLLSGAKARN